MIFSVLDHEKDSKYKVGCYGFWANGEVTKTIVFDVPLISSNRPIFFVTGNIGTTPVFSMCSEDNLNATLQAPTVVDIVNSLSNYLQIQVNADAGDLSKLRIRITTPENMGCYVQVLVPSGKFVSVR